MAFRPNTQNLPGGNMTNPPAPVSSPFTPQGAGKPKKPKRVQPAVRMPKLPQLQPAPQQNGFPPLA